MGRDRTGWVRRKEKGRGRSGAQRPEAGQEELHLKERKNEAEYRMKDS